MRVMTTLIGVDPLEWNISQLQGEVMIFVTDDENNGWVKPWLKKKGFMKNAVVVTLAEMMRLQTLHGDKQLANEALTHPRSPGPVVRILRAEPMGFKNWPPLIKQYAI